MIPVLPFEKILSHLDLQDLIRFKRVSKGWYLAIDRLRVNSLCITEHPIEGKSRWARIAFAQNFIYLPRIWSLSCIFKKSIFSGLKHLRLCEFQLNEMKKSALNLGNQLLI